MATEFAADEPGGAKWLLRAANRDNPVAQNRLSRLLFAGRGLKQDRVEAAKWNILATTAGLTTPGSTANPTSSRPKNG